MKRINNNHKFLEFRQKFDFFEYQSYEINIENRSLNLKFNFNLSNKHIFRPSLCFSLPDNFEALYKDNSFLNNLAFNIGMIELISYWKAACPPRIIVKPHILNEDQVKWWKKLYYNGLGEFFYLNSISVEEEDFVQIESSGSALTKFENNLDFSKVLVPVGGGKDSIVSMEILKNAGVDIYPMMLNPNPARERTIINSGFEINQNFIVNRTIDKTLLELNDNGFLNGHTPFSALLGFVNVTLALINGIGNIALSNENSANESTVPGTNINHQYSKSIEFENDFNYYIQKYLHAELRYFSFLRPLNELQIAYLFAKFPWHFESFRSCNVGSKRDEWCGSCPKCLFTYLLLSPFVAKTTLYNIFKRDLLKDDSLKETLYELSGISKVKPFECVGTVDEVKAVVMNLISDNSFVISNSILSDIDKKIKRLDFEMNDLLTEFNENNNVPENLIKILKKAIDD